jgi:hypothetical protein
MRKGDFVTCKKDYYKESEKIFYKILNRPLFIKNKKYQIFNISNYNLLLMNSGSTYLSTSNSYNSSDYIYVITLKLSGKNLDYYAMDQKLFDMHFYSIAEERHNKLKKIKEYGN